MAGWFPMDLDLQDKPEFLVVQAELGIDADLLVGKLWKFWGWFDEQTTDGVMLRVTAKIINARIGVQGFAEAMIEAGWLAIDDSGATMPGFEKRHSNSSKQRLSHAKRQASYRKRDTPEHTDSTEPARGQHADSTTPAPTSQDKTLHQEEAPNGACPEADEPPSVPSPGCVAVAPEELTQWEFPTVGKSHLWTLPRSKLDEYRDSFPHLNVDSELNAARQWCRDHPKQRKTSQGMTGFLYRWLSKAQNGGSRNGTQSHKHAARVGAGFVNAGDDSVL